MGSVACPVTVLHGAADTIVDPMQALHTATLTPQAELRMVDDLGHFSASSAVIPVLVDLRHRPPGGTAQLVPVLFVIKISMF
jgi:alpha-beta hydrolase superfamily lysophospholipase